MYKGKEIAVLVAAAGSGSRMGADEPKQFLNIWGRPMLALTLEAFQTCEYVDEICVVCRFEDLPRTTEIMAEFPKAVAAVPGGKERQDSVANGLRYLRGNTGFDFVMIHDAARPFVSAEVIEDSLAKALPIGASVPVVPVKETIRSGKITLERSELWTVQTPQTFEKSVIMKAYEQAYSDGFYGTDDASLVERMGHTVALSKGDYANVKVTTPSDLPLPENIRIGHGYDVHELVEGRKLFIGGVEIPHEKGLLGHSDADVLLHALMDALLGACALGDIGKIFPDTDPAYEGISSMELLRRVAAMVDEAGYVASNIDITIAAQRPKIAPYSQRMKENIAEVLKMPVSGINIKGTTAEGLGFIGREEGIAATAVCVLKEKQ